ncbi:type II toxin-antitoxin system RelE/ParE family toxin [Aeromonas veronii]|jgi:mRNA interferase RelE/StbE
MTFELEFDPRAWKEWQKLGDTVRQQFKKKLVKVLNQPQIEANRLHNLPNCYKIKLRNAGFRLVYQVLEQRVVVFVIAVGKRERKQVYLDADIRLKEIG